MYNKIVTDGTRVYKNYQWNKEKQIVSKLTGKILKGDRSLNYCNYCLYQKDGKFRRERTVLLKASFPEMFQPEHKELYMDVFGMEDKYCFLKSDPNVIWSKTTRSFISPHKPKDGHLFFSLKLKGNKWCKQKYIHVMVWESYNKKKYDGKKYNLHHIEFDSKQNNTIQNLMLLPAHIHHSFHNLLQMYIGKERKSYGHKYTKQLNYQKFVKIINSYVGVSVKDKQRLIDSINSLNLKISK